MRKDKKNTKNKKLKVAKVAAGLTAGALVTLAIKKLPESRYKNNPEEKNPFEGKQVKFVYDDADAENADGVKGHLEPTGTLKYKTSFYDKYCKRALDILISGTALIILSPVFAGISIAIQLDDPGTILFCQKRVGKNKQYFKLHKFRSMKMSTPKNVPTHMLKNPDSYITRVGKFLREHSLDELPQVWDIFLGNMSVIGPRPGLWNQDLLTAERDKYDVSAIRPGLTGLAQISGRDELEIKDKAKLDGDYANNQSLALDTKLFFGSVDKVAADSAVVEGGTGSLNSRDKNPQNSEAEKFLCKDYTKGVADKDLIGNIGFDEEVHVDKTLKRKVLITGANSYIGESFKNYAEDNYPDNFEIDTIDMIDGTWRNKDFSKYDIVYHVAGLAHADVGNVNDDTKIKYYSVNTKLAVEVCKKAKEDGVKEFIFMSSMIVYGDSAPVGQEKMIDINTVPAASNFYGDSKFQADVAVRQMASKDFKVFVLRPPMIYGKGSKGNFPMLVKLAKILPVFPKVKNQRSMLYIENLCEFLCQIMLVRTKQNSTVLIPQNAEYSNTSDVVKMISKALGKKMIAGKGIMSFSVKCSNLFPKKFSDLANKAFGNNCYKHDISQYSGIDYQKCNLLDSINKTLANNNKKILILVNHEIVIYNFRLELVETLLDRGYDVHLSSPGGKKIDKLIKMGCIWHPVQFDRHGKNIRYEVDLLKYYKKLCSLIRPLVVLGYTIKPNIYGAMAASKYNIPFIANITGLGSAVENGGIGSKALVKLYKYAFKNVHTVFFQNKSNMQFFKDNGIAIGKHKLLPGSGVNTEKFKYLEYPDDNIVRFCFVSRIMKEKGIDLYLQAAREIKSKFPNTEFHICGFCEEDYKDKLEEYQNKGIIIYHGMIDDISSFYRDKHCLISPSFHEGMSNVCLEAAASGRPIIASNVPGCMETFNEGVSGFGFTVKDAISLVAALERFLKLNYEQKKQMGLEGRNKMVNEFDRNIIVNEYLTIINDLEGGNI